MVRSDAARRRLGRFRTLQHRQQHARRAPFRPAGASPRPEGTHRLFRACAATAAELSHRHAHGPADEDHAHRYRYAVGLMAIFLSRASHELHFAYRADAADAVYQLAFWPVADRTLLHFR